MKKSIYTVNGSIISENTAVGSRTDCRADCLASIRRQGLRLVTDSDENRRKKSNSIVGGKIMKPLVERMAAARDMAIAQTIDAHIKALISVLTIWPGTESPGDPYSVSINYNSHSWRRYFREDELRDLHAITDEELESRVSDWVNQAVFNGYLPTSEMAKGPAADSEDTAQLQPAQSALRAVTTYTYDQWGRLLNSYSAPPPHSAGSE